MKRVSVFLIAVCLLLAMIPFRVLGEESIRSMIEGLPTVEAFQSMTREEQVDAYNRTQYAYEAYMALSTAEEKAALEGAEEKFDALFSYFNTMIMPLEPEEETGKVSYNQFIWVVLLAVIAVPVVSMMRKKRR